MKKQRVTRKTDPRPAHVAGAGPRDQHYVEHFRATLEVAQSSRSRAAMAEWRANGGGY